MKTVSVVITCHGEAEQLPLMLLCLDLQRMCTTGKNSRDGTPFQWSMGEKSTLPIERVIVSDGPLEIENQAWWTRFMGQDPYKVKEVPKEPGVGHNTRSTGLNAATGHFVVLTNQDNYFVMGWRHRIEEHLKDDTGIVYWNGISNLWKYTDYGGSQFKRGFIDLSFVAVQSDIAKRVGYSWRHYDSDWDYINACVIESKRVKLKITHINEVLSIHN